MRRYASLIPSLFVGVLLGIANLWACSTGPAPSIIAPEAVRADPERLDLCIREADTILVGRLKGFDQGWMAPAGAAELSATRLAFSDCKCLKGTLPAEEVEVKQLLIWNKVYMEKGSPERGGIRLSRAFFREGARYIVLIKHLSMNDPKYPEPWVVANNGYGIWMASDGNVTFFKKALGE